MRHAVRCPAREALQRCDGDAMGKPGSRRAQEHALRRPPAALESSALDQSSTSSRNWLARADVIGAKRVVVTKCGRHTGQSGPS